MKKLALLTTLGLLTACGAGNGGAGGVLPHHSAPACALGQAVMVYPMRGATVTPTTDVYYAVDQYVALNAFGQGAVFSPGVSVASDAQVRPSLVPSPHTSPGFAKATYFKVRAGFASSTTYTLGVQAQFDPSPEIGPCEYYGVGSFTTT